MEHDITSHAFIIDSVYIFTIVYDNGKIIDYYLEADWDENDYERIEIEPDIFKKIVQIYNEEKETK